MVEGAAVAFGREEAERHPEERPRRSSRRSRARSSPETVARSPPSPDGARRCSCRDRRSRRLLEVLQVLHVDRPVEPVHPLDLLDRPRASPARPSSDSAGPPGSARTQRKSENREPEENRDEQQQPADDEAEHLRHPPAASRYRLLSLGLGLGLGSPRFPLRRPPLRLSTVANASPPTRPGSGRSPGCSPRTRAPRVVCTYGTPATNAMIFRLASW